jgi:hypothetical protein
MEVHPNMSREPHKTAVDPRPCGYCWYHVCDLDGMECAEKHAPEGGFAEVHAECDAAIDRYMEAIESFHA